MNTVASIFEEFIDSRRAQGCTARTLQSYEQRAGAFLAEHGERPIDSISEQDIEQWAAGLYAQRARWKNHPCKPREAGGLSPATIRGRIMAIQIFFKWCVDRRKLPVSPAYHLRKPTAPRIVEGKVMALDDLFLMLNEAGRRAEDGQCRDLALLCFMADTGARAGEVAGLDCDHVDMERMTARVDGKTGPGVVTFTGATAAAVNEWLVERRTWVNGSGERALFVGLHPPNVGGRLNRDSVYQIFERIADAAGVPPGNPVNPHSVRHLVGQEWADRVNLALVQAKLRHASITTTTIYAHQNDLKRVASATEQISLVKMHQQARRELLAIDTQQDAVDVVIATDDPDGLEGALYGLQAVLLRRGGQLVRHGGGYVARAFAHPGFLKLAVENAGLGVVMGQLKQLV